MARYIRAIKGIGIHGRFDLDQYFQPGINILYGRNGTGKTTLLHILANALNGNYERFAYLKFKTIVVEIVDDQTLFSQIVMIEKLHSEREQEIVVTLDGKRLKPILSRQAIELDKKDTEREPFRRNLELREKLRKPTLSAAYFPAFRTMIEAWNSLDDNKVERLLKYSDLEIERFRRAEGIRPPSTMTKFAREVFGDFVPDLSYPSPIEIEQRVAAEANSAIIAIGRTDRELLSSVFLDVFAALYRPTQTGTQPPETILQEITKLSNQLAESPLKGETDRGIYPQLSQLLRSAEDTQRLKEESAAKILDVYHKSLIERVRVQTESFKGIEQYLDSVNKFLESKKLIISTDEGPRTDLKVRILFADDAKSSVRALSSGERQIVTLIYAATHMSEQQVVLIDEPEISLHVDWQRALLASMGQQLGERQIIACTHSPVIGADYEERMFELKLTPTEISQADDTDISELTN